MAYKISGTKNESAKIYVIDELGDTLESTTLISGSGAYQVDRLSSGAKSIIARTDSGKEIAYGNVDPIYYIGLVATGGTITTDDGYKVHTFTENGDFNVSVGDVVDILIIAGGGGGAGSVGSAAMGAGGAGGFKFFKDKTLIPQSYSVVIGDGGAGGIADTMGNKGEDSSFADDVAEGGGGGGNFKVVGGAGGSGGGGGARLSTSGGAGTANQGNDGGNAAPGDGTADDAGGGGGGSSEVGENAGIKIGGDGGDGYQEGVSTVYDWEADDLSTETFVINGTFNYYAGGGGGGTELGTIGSGGAGGGGAGGKNSAGVSGLENTGGGGGGAAYQALVSVNGGVGGSGIVIIRYQN